jgi:H+/Cl- antiporter ClcA
LALLARSIAGENSVHHSTLDSYLAVHQRRAVPPATVLLLGFLVRRLDPRAAPGAIRAIKRISRLADAVEGADEEWLRSQVLEVLTSIGAIVGSTVPPEIETHVLDQVIEAFRLRAVKARPAD